MYYSRDRQSDERHAHPTQWRHNDTAPTVGATHLPLTWRWMLTDQSSRWCRVPIWCHARSEERVPDGATHVPKSAMWHPAGCSGVFTHFVGGVVGTAGHRTLTDGATHLPSRSQIVPPTTDAHEQSGWCHPLCRWRSGRSRGTIDDRLGVRTDGGFCAIGCGCD